MKVEFKRSFIKDLKSHSTNKNLLTQIQNTIHNVEEAENINALKNLKKLKSDGFYYRIRIGNYRIGIIIKEEIVTFVRVLHRSEIYRYFP